MPDSRSLKTIAAFLVLLLFISMQAPGAFAAQNRTLILSGPPFPTGWMLDTHGEIGGKRPEMFGEIANHAGYNWIGKLFPAKRLMQSIAEGTVDLSMLVKNPLLDKPDLILTSSEPIYTENLNIYGLKDSPPVEYRNDLQGKRIVVMRGYGYGGFKTWLDDPANQVELYEVDTFEQAISVLIKRDLDYALLYDLNFEAGLNTLLINENEALLDQAKAFTLTEWSKVPVFFHLSKKALPDADQVLTRLMYSFHELQKEGVIPPVETMDMPGDRP